MKKFLAILLIAAITCVEFSKPTQDEVFNLFDMDDAELNIFTSIWDKIKGFFTGAWNAIKKGISWLKEKGLWDHIKTVLKTLGGTAAKAACSALASSEMCETVINALLKKDN